MKLVDTLIFSLAVAIFVIGAHQTFTVGIGGSYWIFMFCFGLVMLYKLRKDKSSPAAISMNKGTAKEQPSKKPAKISSKASTNSTANPKKPGKPGGSANRGSSNPQPIVRK